MPLLRVSPSAETGYDVATYTHRGGSFGGIAYPYHQQPGVQPGYRRRKEGCAQRTRIYHQSGQPSHVLLSYDHYRKLVYKRPNIADILGETPGIADIDFEIPRLDDVARAAVFD